MPTLHQLTNIILKQEVVNILNIANLVPQGIVNENQCTDKVHYPLLHFYEEVLCRRW